MLEKMVLNSFQILLDKKVNSFNPGEKVTGNVSYGNNLFCKIKIFFFKNFCKLIFFIAQK
jgi:hypothetical protein